MLKPPAFQTQQRSGLPFDDRVQSRAAGPGRHESKCAVRPARGELASSFLLLPGVVLMRPKTLGWDVSTYRIRLEVSWEILTALFLTRQGCTQRSLCLQVWKATLSEITQAPVGFSESPNSTPCYSQGWQWQGPFCSVTHL